MSPVLYPPNFSTWTRHLLGFLLFPSALYIDYVISPCSSSSFRYFLPYGAIGYVCLATGNLFLGMLLAAVCCLFNFLTSRTYVFFGGCVSSSSFASVLLVVLEHLTTFAGCLGAAILCQVCKIILVLFFWWCYPTKTFPNIACFFTDRSDRSRSGSSARQGTSYNLLFYEILAWCCAGSVPYRFNPATGARPYRSRTYLSAPPDRPWSSSWRGKIDDLSVVSTLFIPLNVRVLVWCSLYW